MTNEEAIAIEHEIMRILVVTEEHKERVFTAHKMAIEALEKQIPKKVVYKMGCHGGVLCPNCRTVFEYRMDNWKSPFCQHCGQALEWNGVK